MAGGFENRLNIFKAKSLLMFGAYRGGMMAYQMIRRDTRVKAVVVAAGKAFRHSLG